MAARNAPQALVGLEVKMLTTRVPMRLQRRGGRKLMMMPEKHGGPGAEVPL